MRASKRSGNLAHVLVTLDEAHRGKLASVKERLEREGMIVEETFELGGVVAGEIPTRMMGRLKSLKGVESVEIEPEFKAGS